MQKCDCERRSLASFASRGSGEMRARNSTVVYPACRQILDVDLMQTVHALARKTYYLARYTENEYVCQLVGYPILLAQAILSPYWK